MTLLTDLNVACMETEGGRLVLHMVRGLRNKQSKAEKAEARSGNCIAFRVPVKG